ncbi:MAG: 4-(cytidine 5'-diphospho)-2-C-methyl-D-erythritol kinase, partial [Lachnospiraceae bacterium]|nr:4-(cytidine 5'-diphospho)-2-C-methyl-D-erythritol kinase [Lachnospiraceae bacterium]
GSDNLIYIGARLLFDLYKITSGIRIRLKKSIPVAAGMAGGSADAAAALKGINEMFRLGCTEAELKNMGLKLGADVPYCVMGGTALAEGIGERLTALDEAPQCVLLVAKPAINVSTKYVYQRLDDLETYEHPDIDGMVKAISEGSLEGIVSRLGNVLESVTVPEYPIINDIKRIMLESGAMGSLMSGSGPAVFGIYGDRADAGTALRKLGEYGFAAQTFITDFRQEVHNAG